MGASLFRSALHISPRFHLSPLTVQKTYMLRPWHIDQDQHARGIGLFEQPLGRHMIRANGIERSRLYILQIGSHLIRRGKRLAVAVAGKRTVRDAGGTD